MLCYAFLFLETREEHFFPVTLAIYIYIKKSQHEIEYFTTFPFSQIANKSLLTTGSSSHLFTQTYRFPYKGVLKRCISLVLKHTVGIDFYCLLASCTGFLFQKRKSPWSMTKKKAIPTPFLGGIWNLSISVAVGMQLCILMLFKTINNSSK